MSTAQPPSAPRRLLFRLLPGVVLAALLPFVGLIAVAISTVYDDTRREIDSRLEQAITQAARPLEAHLTDAIDRLSTATETDTAPASTAEGQAWLDAHPDLRGVFDNLVVVSASGIVLADAPALPQQRGTDMAWHPIFKAVRESRRLQIPEPFLSSAGQRPVASFAAPLHGPDGGFSGLVIGSIELARNPILADVENTRIGRTGHLLVVSSGAAISSGRTTRACCSRPRTWPTGSRLRARGRKAGTTARKSTGPGSRRSSSAIAR